jgi:hypothetical protein
MSLRKLVGLALVATACAQTLNDPKLDFYDNPTCSGDPVATYTNPDKASMTPANVRSTFGLPATGSACAQGYAHMNSVDRSYTGYMCLKMGTARSIDCSDTHCDVAASLVGQSTWHYHKCECTEYTYPANTAGTQPKVYVQYVLASKAKNPCRTATNEDEWYVAAWKSYPWAIVAGLVCCVLGCICGGWCFMRWLQRAEARAEDAKQLRFQQARPITDHVAQQLGGKQIELNA